MREFLVMIGQRPGGENLQDQLRLCREHAEKIGYQIVEELAEDDRGASGATFDLPELSKALEMAREGSFDALVVRELDRLSRDLAKQLIVEQELKRAGVVIEYVLYDFPDTPEGRLNKNLRAMLAEYEREKIAQRMTRGRRRSARQGNVFPGTFAPFGYKLVRENGKRTFEIDPVAAPTIKLIFEWYTVGDGEQGPLSATAIANKLTELKVPSFTDLYPRVGNVANTRARKPCSWPQSTVASILDNETDAGTWRYGHTTRSIEDTIPIPVPAIIDAETWQKAQERKAENKRNSRRNTKFNYLLRRIVRCGECGRKMRAYTVRRHGKGKRDYHYYHCRAKFDHMPCDNVLRFSATQVDKAVWNWLETLFQDETTLLQALEEEQAEREKQLLPRKQELETVNLLITKQQNELEKLLDLYLSSDFPKALLTERRDCIEATLAGLQARQEHLQKLISDGELNADQIYSILEMREQVANGLKEAGSSFESQRAIVEILQLTAALSVAEGNKIVDVSCVIGSERLEIVSKTTSTC